MKQSLASHRRRSAIGLAIVVGLAPMSVVAQDPEPQTELRIVERATGSIDRGLEYLVSKQKADGSWHNNNAVNALAILAMLGRGHVPGRGPYRDALEKAKRYLLATQKENGYLSFNQMYEHGLATLALAELYGTDPDPKVEEGLRKAIDLIVKCQSAAGGWRYAPAPNDQDMSVTVMQVVALRAANNAEVPVPSQTIEKAIAYVKSCAHPSGGYAYQAGGGPTPQVSAAGVLCLHLLGKGDDPTIPKALEYLQKLPAQWDPGPIQYFYYFHYYAIQANYHAGGKQWDEWHPKVRELLLGRQNSDGSWDLPPGMAENEGTVGPNKVYATAMACLVLEIYTHYLPAYQR